MQSKDSGLFRRRIHWENHYLDGRTPWDTGETPPEVRTFWSSNLLPPVGVALDMGCGTGTNLAFLASLGLEAYGLELSRAALAIAQRRLDSLPAAVSARIHLTQSDVARPPMRGIGARYVLDIGCLHTVPRSERASYASAVVENMACGGYYHLYGHARVRLDENDGAIDRGLAEGEVAELFTPYLTLISILSGTPDPRPSAWYLLRKP